MRPDVSVHFTLNEKGTPAGKLADAELHFHEGPLAGLKLIGFGVWERRGHDGRNVTLPARQYTVNGERRSFSLLRPQRPAGGVAWTDDQHRVRALILDAFSAEESLAYQKQGE